MKLWRRYLWKQIFQSFFFFLIVLSFFYCFIDFSMHGVKFLKKIEFNATILFTEYLKVLSVYFNLFISLSFLLTFLKVLLNLQKHGELIALQMAGISLSRIITPFIQLSLILSLLSYANHEWGYADLPSAKKSKKKWIVSVVLADNSELVYRKHIQGRPIEDAFWIRSPDEIWHFKSLIKSNPPQAAFADHFARTEEGFLEKRASYDTIELPQLKFQEDGRAQHIPIENRSLSQLSLEISSQSAQAPRASAHLHYKLASAFVPFCILGWICPFIFRFSRNRSSFIFIASSLFAYIAFLALLDSLLILTENQVLSPWLSLWPPIALSLASLLLFLTRKY